MEWVEDELGCVNIGDERLNRRAKTLLKRLGANPSASIPESCKGWQETEAAYRFFENDLVTSKKLLNPIGRRRLIELKGIRWSYCFKTLLR